ncbi:hypothetical protein J6590_034139 [Homalodisca vitripennis]|nr:hypothetical protein J6590_034139 [Homalodisca vitripennis]
MFRSPGKTNSLRKVELETDSTQIKEVTVWAAVSCNGMLSSDISDSTMTKNRYEQKWIKQSSNKMVLLLITQILSSDLNDNLHGRWIGRGSDFLDWPHRSPYLTPFGQRGTLAPAPQWKSFWPRERLSMGFISNSDIQVVTIDLGSTWDARTRSTMENILAQRATLYGFISNSDIQVVTIDLGSTWDARTRSTMENILAQRATLYGFISNSDIQVVTIDLGQRGTLAPALQWKTF